MTQASCWSGERVAVASGRIASRSSLELWATRRGMSTIGPTTCGRRSIATAFSAGRMWTLA
eukprot:CAMPEP_0183392394 /NCGR_PEP_ID=MMETSP0370-20130417/7124_1 /TAXON_ID=268820 /ORGANISM="Peridinium aciculiferum, Strain PAER-2" /LENGTH=60 /DNA_ID=CAMNT_0025572321 /DNA_START=54 /DNA_END=232 /DNA_ORIENTATION=+